EEASLIASKKKRRRDSDNVDESIQKERMCASRIDSLTGKPILGKSSLQNEKVAGVWGENSDERKTMREHGILSPAELALSSDSSQAGEEQEEKKTKRLEEYPTVCPICGGYLYVQIRFRGQAFLLHQIRKMVGTALTIMRGQAPACFIPVAFKQHLMPTPVAPGNGLLLVRGEYVRYRKDFPHHLDPEFNDLAWQTTKFRKEMIWKNIVTQENVVGHMGNFLSTLDSEKVADMWEMCSDVLKTESKREVTLRKRLVVIDEK
ncbi:Pseudouridine synthase I, TruA like protein, partial [Aduncisulcus paluster]